MRRMLYLLSFVFALGCAHSAKNTAIALVVASDRAADSFADVWEDFVDRSIDHCRSLELPTPEERRECLGPAADSRLPKSILKKLIAAQLVVKLAIECEVNASLRPLLECPSPDWRALASAVRDAWAELTPYVQAAMEGRR